MHLRVTTNNNIINRRKNKNKYHTIVAHYHYYIIILYYCLRTRQVVVTRAFFFNHGSRSYNIYYDNNNNWTKERTLSLYYVRFKNVKTGFSFFRRAMKMIIRYTRIIYNIYYFIIRFGNVKKNIMLLRVTVSTI